MPRYHVSRLRYAATAATDSAGCLYAMLSRRAIHDIMLPRVRRRHCYATDADDAAADTLRHDVAPQLRCRFRATLMPAYY